MTAPRKALLHAIWAFEGHFTVEMVRETLSESHPSVNNSTIYRTLELLSQLGVLNTLLGSTPTQYERPHERHHHLICTQCGAVALLGDYHFDDLVRHLLKEHAFAADFTHLAIPGRCKPCQEAVS